MSVYSIMGAAASICLLLPVFSVIFLRLTSHRSFPILIGYYLMTFICNILSLGYIKMNPAVLDTVVYINNLLDTPVILYFLTYFNPLKEFRKKTMWIILGFVVYEIIILLWNGPNTTSLTVIQGPGIALVICYCVQLFSHQVQLAITNHKASGKAFMISSLLFSYGTFMIIFLMSNIFQIQIDESGKPRLDYVQDLFLIFYIATIISCVTMTWGLYIESKRIQKLAELKIARKELSEIYSEREATTPFRAVALDFDTNH
jgi:hypothetical protein